jgi:hypothetical protein
MHQGQAAREVEFNYRVLEPHSFATHVKAFSSAVIHTSAGAVQLMNVMRCFLTSVEDTYRLR